MTRNVLPLVAGIALSLVLYAGPASAAEGHGEQMKKCAKECAECQVVCDSCSEHCLTKAGEGKKDHARCSQMCADCAECCKTCATLCARKSPLARPMLKCCEECCKECAAMCEKFDDDKHIAECAKTCRDCAKSCADMLKHTEANPPSDK
ncbi:MAG: hypothetical protein ACTHK7_16130 [Aureliella sp.]